MSDQSDTDVWVECPICRHRFHSLVRHIAAAHKLTAEMFIYQYPEWPLIARNTHIAAHRSVPYIQHRVFMYLTGLLGDTVKEEYQLGSLFIDIAIPDKKLAIEIDGTFFHGNKLDSPIVQRCKRYDKYKHDVLEKLSWKLLRVTDREVYEQLPVVLQSICDFIGIAYREVTDTDFFPGRIVHCQTCGKRMTFAQFYSRRIFCCPDHTREQKADGTVYHQCSWCGTRTSTLPVRTTDGVVRYFCNAQCQQQYFTAHVRDIPCLNCGVMMHLLGPDTRTFCCNNCYQEYMAAHPEYRAKLSRDSDYNCHRRDIGRVSFKCAYCGKESWTHARSLRNSHSGRLFCGNECYHAFTKGKTRTEIRSKS